MEEVELPPLVAKYIECPTDVTTLLRYWRETHGVLLDLRKSRATGTSLITACDQGILSLCRAAVSVERALAKTGVEAMERGALLEGLFLIRFHSGDFERYKWASLTVDPQPPPPTLYAQYFSALLTPGVPKAVGYGHNQMGLMASLHCRPLALYHALRGLAAPSPFPTSQKDAANIFEFISIGVDAMYKKRAAWVKQSHGVSPAALSPGGGAGGGAAGGVGSPEPLSDVLMLCGSPTMRCAFTTWTLCRWVRGLAKPWMQSTGPEIPIPLSKFLTELKRDTGRLMQEGNTLSLQWVLRLFIMCITVVEARGCENRGAGGGDGRGSGSGSGSSGSGSGSGSSSGKGLGDEGLHGGHMFFSLLKVTVSTCVAMLYQGERRGKGKKRGREGATSGGRGGSDEMGGSDGGTFKLPQSTTLHLPPLLRIIHLMLAYLAEPTRSSDAGGRHPLLQPIEPLRCPLFALERSQAFYAIASLGNALAKVFPEVCIGSDGKSTAFSAVGELGGHRLEVLEVYGFPPLESVLGVILPKGAIGGGGGDFLAVAASLGALEASAGYLTSGRGGGNNKPEFTLLLLPQPMTRPQEIAVLAEAVRPIFQCLKSGADRDGLLQPHLKLHGPPSPNTPFFAETLPKVKAVAAVVVPPAAPPPTVVRQVWVAPRGKRQK